MQINKKIKQHFFFQLMLTVFMVFNAGTIHAAAAPESPALKRNGPMQAGAFSKSWAGKFLIAQKAGQAGGLARDQKKTMEEINENQATVAAISPLTATFAIPQTEDYTAKRPTPLTIIPTSPTIDIMPIQEERDDRSYSSILINCHTKLKLSMEQKFNLDNIAAIFNEADDAYQQFSKLDQKKSAILWQNFTQYHGKFFAHIKDCFEKSIKQMHEQKNELNFRTKEKIAEPRIIFLFAKPVNPWHIFINASNHLKEFFERKSCLCFTKAVWASNIAAYQLSIEYAESHKQTIEIMEHLKILLDNIEKDIEQKNKHDHIACYISLSKQYDFLHNTFIRKSDDYEKKRIQYQNLLQKNNKEMAATKK